MTGIITECGNGLAVAGETVMNSDGTLYIVGRSRGPIQTGRSPGCGDWEEVELEEIGDAASDPHLCCDDGGHHDECTCLISSCTVRVRGEGGEE